MTCIVCGQPVPGGKPQHASGECLAIVVRPPVVEGRLVALMLVTPLLRSRLLPGDPVTLPSGATFAIVERVGTGDDWTMRLHASDLDVPRGTTPVEYGERIARNRGAADLAVQRDLLCWLGAEGWTAWDSRARTEERLLPAGAVWPTERTDGFMLRAKPAAVAA